MEVQSPRRCGANPHKATRDKALSASVLGVRRSDFKMGHMQRWFNRARTKFPCASLIHLYNDGSLRVRLAGYPRGRALIFLTIRDFVLLAAGEKFEDDFLRS